MKFSPQSLLRAEITGMQPYTPIQPYEVLSARLGIEAEKIVKLDANENPYGPLPCVQQALASHPWYHIYPDPQHTQLREALAQFIALPAEYILPTHGADEMLDLLCRMFLRAGESIVNCPPTFGMYAFDAELAAAQVIDCHRLENFATPVENICKQVLAAQGSNRACKLVFVTSPNNPTGNWLTDAELNQLLSLPALIVLDEAYVEFASKPSRVSWVQRHDNLVVLRTFSKAAGIAGLRLGYGICPQWLMDELWKFKQPYNVNVAATVAGLASLAHADEIKEVVEKMVAERERLRNELMRFNWLSVHPSEGNFLLCDVADSVGAITLVQRLESRGVLVRYYNKPELKDCIRISVGRPEHTDRLLEELLAFDVT